MYALSSQNLDSSFCDPFSSLPFTLKPVLQHVGHNHGWTLTLSPVHICLHFSRAFLSSSLLGSSFLFSYFCFFASSLSCPLNITCTLHLQLIQPQLYFPLGLSWCSCWHVMQYAICPYISSCHLSVPLSRGVMFFGRPLSQAQADSCWLFVSKLDLPAEIQWLILKESQWDV